WTWTGPAWCKRGGGRARLTPEEHHRRTTSSGWEGSNAASRASGVTLLEDPPGGDELGPPAQRRRIELSARCVAGRTGHLGRTGEDGRGARYRTDHRAGPAATDRPAGRLARWTQPGDHRPADDLRGRRAAGHRALHPAADRAAGAHRRGQLLL